MCAQFSTGQHMGWPVTRPSNSQGGPWKWQAGPYEAGVSWASLLVSLIGPGRQIHECHAPGRADNVENSMRRAGQGRESLKM